MKTVDGIPLYIVGIWLVLFSLASFYFTALFWGPAIEFTQFEGTQSEQIDQARDAAANLQDEIAVVDGASQQIEDAQTAVETGDQIQVELQETTEAIESVEDALSELPADALAPEVAAVGEALDEAQQQVAEAAADDTMASKALETAEDAVDQAQTAVEQSVVNEVRDVVQEAPQPVIRVLWLFDWRPGAELLQLLLAVSGAGVGTAAGALSTITTLIGQQKFKASWLAWHAARPLWSVSAAIIGYAAIRGGLLNINNSASALNPFAIFAIGAILGMNASDSLKALGRILRPGTEPHKPNDSDEPDKSDEVDEPQGR